MAIFCAIIALGDVNCRTSRRTTSNHQPFIPPFDHSWLSRSSAVPDVAHQIPIVVINQLFVLLLFVLFEQRNCILFSDSMRGAGCIAPLRIRSIRNPPPPQLTIAPPPHTVVCARQSGLALRGAAFSGKPVEFGGGVTTAGDGKQLVLQLI